MPFSLDQHPFSTASQATPACYNIIDRKPDHKIPFAMLMQNEAASADEISKLADNLKDFMNDMPARHYFGQERRTLHYTLLPNGLSFSFHYHDESGHSTGISKPAATLICVPGQYETFLKMISDRLDKFTLGVLKAGSEIEQRAVPRAHHEKRGIRSSGPIVSPPA